MRWTHPTPPKKGDTRTVTAFLWWPKRVGQETRWLETATWQETWSLVEHRFQGLPFYERKWVALVWGSG
jgi:hypothetical protein